MGLCSSLMLHTLRGSMLLASTSVGLRLFVYVCLFLPFPRFLSNSPVKCKILQLSLVTYETQISFSYRLPSFSTPSWSISKFPDLVTWSVQLIRSIRLKNQFSAASVYFSIVLLFAVERGQFKFRTMRMSLQMAMVMVW